MPVDPLPAAPVAAAIPHYRKLAFATGALVAGLAIAALRLALGA